MKYADFCTFFFGKNIVSFQENFSLRESVYLFIYFTFYIYILFLFYPFVLTPFWLLQVLTQRVKIKKCIKLL